MIRRAVGFRGGDKPADDDDTQNLYDEVVRRALANGSFRKPPAWLEEHDVAGHLIDSAASSNLVRHVAWPRPS